MDEKQHFLEMAFKTGPQAYQKTNVLLFVDNCAAHSEDVKEKLKNVEIMTLLLQPMDQGIVCNSKTHYRKSILTKLLIQREDKKYPTPINLSDAIQNLSNVWNCVVKHETISNCFRKAGFEEVGTKANSSTPWNEEDFLLLSDIVILESPLKPVANINTIFNDYINVDSNVITTDNLSDEKV